MSKIVIIVRSNLKIIVMRALISPWQFRAILSLALTCLSTHLSSQTLFSPALKNAGIQFTHQIPDVSDVNVGTGAAWFDCDMDGDLDLYITQRVGSNHLYRNNWIGLGKHGFTNITNGDAHAEEFDGAGVAAADYDNDGDIDLYLANGDRDILLQNDGNCNFIDITSEAFPLVAALSPGRSTSAAWGDINSDGWLDLYVTNYQGRFHNLQATTQDLLFLNNGGEPVTFTDISFILAGDFDNEGVQDINAYGFASTFTDIDNDQDLDLFVINDCPFGPEDNKFWRNDGNLQMTEISDFYGPFQGGKADQGTLTPKPDCQNAMGIAVGDPNRDGLMDYFYSNWNEADETAVFLLNTGTILLDVTREVGLKDRVIPESGSFRLTWGVNFIDYDLDMLQDLAVAAGTLDGTGEDLFTRQPNLLYHNQGIINDLPNYVRIDDQESGMGDTGKGRTMISGDYDLDGDLDLFLVNYGADPILYENSYSGANNWIRIVLNGHGQPLSNKNGIGAKVSVHTEDGITQFAEVRSGSSLGGGDDIALHFGLLRNIDPVVTISWPSGLQSIHSDVKINQTTNFYEVEGDAPTNQDGIRIRLSPVPMYSDVNLEFDVHQTSNVEIYLTSIIGVNKYLIFKQANTPAGFYQKSLDLTVVEPGIYILYMTIGDRAHGQRVIKR